MNGDISVYLQSDNAGYSILFTDGDKHWFHIVPENGVFEGVDLYNQTPLTTVQLLRETSAGFADIWVFYGRNELEVTAYRGLTSIDDIDELENYIKNRNAADGVVWYEIPRNEYYDILKAAINKR